MMDNDGWIHVDKWTELRANKYRNNYSIMRGKEGDNGVIYPQYSIASKRVNSQSIPIKNKDGEWWVIPPGFSLGKDKQKALQIWAAIGEQLRRL